MALEHEGIPETEGSNPELEDMTRRFLVGAVLATPLFILEMGGHLGLLHLEHVVRAVSLWIQFTLATPIVLWCAWPFFQRAWASVLNRSPNMFTLIALGVGASYLYSLVATVAPALFPAGLRLHGGMIPVYYEAAAAVTVLVLLGQVLELRAREKTGGAIRALLQFAPKTVRMVPTKSRPLDTYRPFRFSDSAVCSNVSLSLAGCSAGRVLHTHSRESLPDIPH